MPTSCYFLRVIPLNYHSVTVPRAQVVHKDFETWIMFVSWNTSCCNSFSLGYNIL